MYILDSSVDYLQLVFKLFIFESEHSIKSNTKTENGSLILFQQIIISGILLLESISFFKFHTLKNYS